MVDLPPTTERERLLCALDWNRRHLDWAWKDRNTKPEAQRNARRFSNNIAVLEAQLLTLSR